MTARERFRTIMSFQSADGLPLMEIEGYEEPTVQRWHNEGLPAEKSPGDVLGIGGIQYLPINMYPEPPFKEEIVSEDDDYQFVRNWFGVLVKRPKDRTEYAYEGYLEMPVKDRESWDAFRKRAFECPILDRFGDSWGPELWETLNTSDQPVGLLIHPFFFRLGLYSLGLEDFMLAFYEQPDLVHEMFEHRARMTMHILDEVLPHVKLDCAVIAEDFAYRTGPHISREMYREFWDPHQPQVIDRLHAADIPVIAMWSSGDLRPMIPTLIDVGFNTMWPCEAFCGMHVAELRKQYGRDMRFAGNIGIRAVAAGKEAIDREIETKVLPLLDEGGYIPTLDDQAPPEISWDHYSYYVNRLRELG